MAGVLVMSSAGLAQDSDEGFTVALAQAHLQDPFQQILLDQIETQVAEQGGTLVGATNASDDTAKQITDVSTLLTYSPDAIILLPVDAEAIIPAIDQAAAQGTAVVAIDQAPAGGDVYVVARADNLRMGAEACQTMGDILGGQGTVLELQGDLASANGLQRSVGFMDCMTADFPEINVIQQPTQWSMEMATTNAQTILSTEDVDGVYWASDFFLPGIRNVLEDLGQWVPVGEEGHVVIVGIDGTPEALQTIRDGYQDATISQPLDLYAKWGVGYSKMAADGVTLEEGPTDHDSTISIDENGILADSLPAPVVTAENVDDPGLWANQVE